MRYKTLLIKLEDGFPNCGVLKSCNQKNNTLECKYFGSTKEANAELKLEIAYI